MRPRSHLLVLIALVLTAPAFAAKRADAPAGYRWESLPDLHAQLLVPQGWQVRRVLEDEYRLAPAKGDTRTALTVNLTRSFGREFRAVEYARSVIVGRTRRYLTLDTFDVDKPPFRGYGAVFLLRPEHDPTVRRLLMLGNSKTNSLYIFTVETPEARWDAVRETLEPVFDHLLLDPSI